MRWTIAQKRSCRSYAALASPFGKRCHGASRDGEDDLRLMETIKSCDIFKNHVLYSDSYLDL